MRANAYRAWFIRCAKRRKHTLVRNGDRSGDRSPRFYCRAPREFLFRRDTRSLSLPVCRTSFKVRARATLPPVFWLICQNQFEAGSIKRVYGAREQCPICSFEIEETRKRARMQARTSAALHRLRKSHPVLYPPARVSYTRCMYNAGDTSNR